jgi:hypothetical protein
VNAVAKLVTASADPQLSDGLAESPARLRIALWGDGKSGIRKKSRSCVSAGPAYAYTTERYDIA